MAIEKLEFFKVTHESIPFTQLLNNVLQNLHDPIALAVWSYLASLPPEWRVNKKQVGNHFKLGENVIKRTFALLKKYNLIEYKQDSVSHGHFGELIINVLNGNKFTGGMNSAPADRRYEIHTSPPVVRKTGGAANAPLINKIESKKEKKREALSVDNFFMSEEQKALCVAKGVEPDKVFSKFADFYSTKRFTRQTWELKLQKWIEDEKPKRTIAKESKQLTKFWEPGNPDYDRVHKNQEKKI